MAKKKSLASQAATNPQEDKLLKEYKKLAKRADQRLVRIQGYRHDKYFQGIDQFAFKTAMRDIRSWSGDNATRFNTKAPILRDKEGKPILDKNGKEQVNLRELQHKIADIKKFLASPSSTKKGLLDVYKKRTDSFNQTMGTNFTWQEMANYWEKFGADDIDRNFDYRTGIRVMDIEKTNKNVKNMKAKMQELLRIGEINQIEYQTFLALEERGVSYKDLKP